MSARDGESAGGAASDAGLRFDGKVVLVTGGVRGVGAGISKVFHDAGATVVACARRPAEVAQPWEHRSCDVRDSDAVNDLIAGIVESHGRLDVAVNNAGGTPFAMAADAGAKFQRKIIELNLLAPLWVSIAANAVMQGAGGGSIVNISSVSGRRPSPGSAAYGAAKAGVDSLTSSLAVEWAPTVRVNAICVGMVETELSELHYGTADGVRSVGRTVPMGRLATPEEIGWAAAFLASPLSSYTTGSVLTMHGGGELPAFLGANGMDQIQDTNEENR